MRKIDGVLELDGLINHIECILLWTARGPTSGFQQYGAFEAAMDRDRSFSLIGLTSWLFADCAYP